MSSLWWKIYECDSDFDKCGASHQLYLWFKVCTYAYIELARYIRAPLNIRDPDTLHSSCLITNCFQRLSLKKGSTNLGDNVIHSKYAGFNGRQFGHVAIRSKCLCWTFKECAQKDADFHKPFKDSQSALLEVRKNLKKLTNKFNDLHDVLQNSIPTLLRLKEAVTCFRPPSVGITIDLVSRVR
uniref:Uncharacterized protein n=1 Tax=Glossina palpalis gambiensis TaxID=67801 RepID=A0A1B0B0B0_9MUSC